MRYSTYEGPDPWEGADPELVEQLIAERDSQHDAEENWIAEEDFLFPPGLSPEAEQAAFDEFLALEEDIERSRRLAAALDRKMLLALDHAAATPDRWLGPDPTAQPGYVPPKGVNLYDIRMRRITMAVRAAATDIALRVRISEQQVHARASRAKTLALRCPQLWQAYNAGQVSEQNANTVADLATTLPPDAIDAWRAFDDALTGPAQTLPPAKFRTRARTARERVHPESIEKRHTRAASERGVWFTPELDGMCTLTGNIRAGDAYAIDDLIDQHARQLRNLPGETRTLAQLRADVLTDLILTGRLPGQLVPRSEGGGDSNPDAGALPHLPTSGIPSDDEDAPMSRTDRDDLFDDDDTPDADTTHYRLPNGAPVTAEVRITIPALSMLGHSDEPAILDGYGPISMAIAKQLAGTATSWIRVLTHPVTGTVIDLDRRTYRVPPSLKRWLGTHHPTCIMPGCNRPAAKSDIDHRIRWADGGTTCADNLGPLCPRHHHLKDETLWAISRDAESGALTFISPTGHATDADPPPF